MLADDPELTVRLIDDISKQPVRIVVDSKARIPLDTKLITDKTAKTIVAVLETASPEKIAALQ